MVEEEWAVILIPGLDHDFDDVGQKEEGTGHVDVAATIGLVTCSVMAARIAVPERLVDDDDAAAAAAAAAAGHRCSAVVKLGASVADVPSADYPVVIDQPFCAATLL